MYSSTNSATNPFPNLSTSPCIADHENSDIFFCHHHNPLTIPLIPTIPIQPTETELNMAASSNAMMSEQDVHALKGEQHNPSHILAGKGSVKKDRHSKIYTSKGLRDRRVRLSIEIARKFFDLQDMLGFDKASKTLDWLLTKSKKAIKELSLNGGLKSLSSTSTNCEVVSDTGDLEERVISKSESLTGLSDEKIRMKKLQNTAVNVLAKESREKARERARERTRVKMCTRRLHVPKKFPDSSHSCLNQPRSWSQQIEGHEQVEGPSSHYLFANQSPKGNIIEESIVIRRKFRPSATMGYQQNLLLLKDARCNYSSGSTSYLPNLAQNWDISSAIAHSSFRAINNMNPSAGLL
ncbi:unnamed protein product [Dovyalis caffra]|uniref:Uncharacterized protein n=1 Tax=Dovyalis caffra TaxID=77055 RepID=A0AAV1RFD6_9ROSI|nr:unnamed protein product [Dovyalis caffra]